MIYAKMSYSRKGAPAMGKAESTIRFAARGCLVRCRQSEAPLTSLSEFADELRKTGWDEHSVRAVEWRVLTDLMGRRTTSPQIEDVYSSPRGQATG
jgi:hypothetical protein